MGYEVEKVDPGGGPRPWRERPTAPIFSDLFNYCLHSKCFTLFSDL